MKTFLAPLLLALTTLSAAAQPAAEINLTRFASTATEKPLPVAISGFTGEIDAIIRFDLSVLGMEFVPAAEAQFIITGRNEANVEGRVLDALSKTPILPGKAYQGSGRAQAHALANDIATAIRKTTPIFLGKIAYLQDSGSSHEVFVSDYDGYNAVQVTRDNTSIWSPAWVPGRRALVYSVLKEHRMYIYHHDLGTGAREVVTRAPGSNMSPSVSPDGRHVAMVLAQDGRPELYVCNIDGTGLRRLTTSKEEESSPCWSPDGQTLCFSASYSGRPALYTLPVTGGTPKKITVIGTGGNITEPDWAPDGQAILFTAQMGSFQICRVSAKGGTAEVLTAGEDAAWAPNSRTAIFTRRSGGRRTLSLLDVPTKRVKDVPRISGSCSQPDWGK